MVPSSPEELSWVIQPLVDAGLGPEQIRVLLFRLAFDAIVTEGRGTEASAQAVVSDQPAAVRAAWTETVGRMLTTHALAE